MDWGDWSILKDSDDEEKHEESIHGKVEINSEALVEVLRIFLKDVKCRIISIDGKKAEQPCYGLIHFSDLQNPESICLKFYDKYKPGTIMKVNILLKSSPKYFILSYPDELIVE